MDERESLWEVLKDTSEWKDIAKRSNFSIVEADFVENKAPLKESNEGALHDKKRDYSI